MRRALPLLLMAACGGPRYAVVERPARPFAEYGSVEVKDVEFLDKRVHKDIREFATWLNRNVRSRLTPRFIGTGPKLVIAPVLDASGLRPEGGVISTRWGGTAALEVGFYTEQGASVGKVLVSAPPSDSGSLAPAGDRLIDDVLDFIAAP